MLAVKWARIALGLAILTLLLELAHAAIDGSKWWLAAVWIFNTACASYILHSVCAIRDHKAEQLVDDALEQLDDWKWRS